jgi:hypothetical protein
MRALLIIIPLIFSLPVNAGDEKEPRWKEKGVETEAICKCTCYIKSEGGGEPVVYSSKLWIKATASTDCKVNNGAECSGKDGPIAFSGKTKDCYKALVNKE